MRLHRILLFLLLASLSGSSAAAQVSLASSTFQTGASAVTPACSDMGNGGVLVPDATASCSQPFGYTSASSASADVATDPGGGTLMASAQAGATAPGQAPSQTSNASAFASSFASWDILGDVLYSVSITSSAPTALQGNLGVNLPPSGSLMAGDTLTTSVNPSVFALARDSGPLTDAESESGTIVVTFATAGSSELAQGTVLADGNPMAGLLVEALVGGSPVASAPTASDGSYLLPGVTVPVILRISDPGGAFLTELSPELTPPITYDANLEPVPAVPGLTAPALAILVMLCAGLRGTRRGGRASGGS